MTIWKKYTVLSIKNSPVHPIHCYRNLKLKHTFLTYKNDLLPQSVFDDNQIVIKMYNYWRVYDNIQYCHGYLFRDYIQRCPVIHITCIYYTNTVYLYVNCLCLNSCCVLRYNKLSRSYCILPRSINLLWFVIIHMIWILTVMLLYKY